MECYRAWALMSRAVDARSQAAAARRASAETRRVTARRRRESAELRATAVAELTDSGALLGRARWAVSPSLSTGEAEPREHDPLAA